MINLSHSFGKGFVCHLSEVVTTQHPYGLAVIARRNDEAISYFHEIQDCRSRFRSFAMTKRWALSSYLKSLKRVVGCIRKS